GLAEEEGESIMALLLRTTPGRGILLALALGFAYLVLRGRRFGRPRVIWRHGSRSAGEYVGAMAMLYRRAGKRGFVSTHFERQLRRDAGAALGLTPGADEQEIMEGARRRGGDESAAAQRLLPVLARLRQGAAADGELLMLVAEGEEAVTTLAGRGHQADTGTAKTLMAKTLARLVSGDFRRVQFTPDLMPSDVVGTNVFDLSTSRFSLRKGPIFCSLLLADEINRAPAKTQSALLEAMEE